MGDDVNAQDDPHGTALQAAVCGIAFYGKEDSREEMIQILLANGAID